jgi:hypothetical protein
MPRVKNTSSRVDEADQATKGGAVGPSSTAPPESDERLLSGEPREPEAIVNLFDLWEGPTPMPGDLEELAADLWQELPPPESLPPLLGRASAPQARPTPAQPASLEAFAPDEAVSASEGGGEAGDQTDELAWPEEAGASITLQPTADDLLADANSKLSRGKHMAALLLAEQALALDPGSDAAERCAEASRAGLCDVYAARLGEMSRTARVVMSLGELRELSLDARLFFLLSRVDGASTLEEIVDMSGMPEHEALRYLCELLMLEAIAIE